MTTDRELLPGTRVRLRSSSHVVELRCNQGIVVRPDIYDDHYVIRLDEPAIYLAADGTRRDLPEIVEAVDNLDIIPELTQGL